MRFPNKLPPKLLLALLTHFEEVRTGIGKPVHPELSLSEAYLTSLKQGPHARSFHYVHDIRTGELIYPHQVSRIMGMSPRSYRDWLDLIHPAYVARYLIMGLKVYQMIYSDPTLELDYLSHKYQIEIPIMEVNTGTYAWYLQQSEPLRFDDEGNMVLQVNFLTKIREFEEEIIMKKISPMIHTSKGTRMRELEQKIERETAGEYLNLVLQEVFTDKGWETLDFLNEGFTTMQIAEALDITVYAVNKRRGQLLLKAKEMINPQIETTDDLLSYLRNHGIFTSG